MKKLLFIVSLVASFGVFAHAQKTPTPNALVEFFNNQGQPCAGCQLVTCGAGLSCPLSPGVNAQATYTTAAGGAQNTNPIVLDSNGRANVWLTPTQTYKYAMFDPVGNALWTVDNIPGQGGGSGGLTVGTTTISGGTSGDFEYNNAGVLGEKGATGTGNVVLSASPTLTGTATLGNATLTNLTVTGTCTGCSAATGLTVGATTITSGTNGDIEYNNSGVLGEKGTTGTGSVVLAASPTLSGTATLNNLTVSGTCTGCNSATGLTVGSTSITSGTNGAIEFNNAGVLGEKAVTGSGSVVLATSPTVSNLTVTGSCTGCGGGGGGLTIGSTTISSGTAGQILYQNTSGGTLGQVVLEDFPTFPITYVGASTSVINGGSIFPYNQTAALEGDQGYLYFLQGDSAYVVLNYALSAFWTGNIDININWFQGSGGSGNVVWSVQTGCITSSTPLPITYNSAQTVTTAAGSANQNRLSTITGLTTTGCSAGYTLLLKIKRATDTFTANAYLTSVVVGVRRTQ